VTDPTPSPGLKGQLWFLPVSATSPTPGTVRLDFADATKLPGFESYVIYLDNGLYAQVKPGQAPPYFVGDRHPETENCYQVAALVITDQPKPPDAKPVCLAADGKGKGSP
jgi:serine/threonine-protein kinase